MSSVDAPARPAAPLPAEEVLLAGFGRTRFSRARIARPGDGREVAELLASGVPARGLIARGAGRSYGDPAQNEGGLVLETSALSQIGALDSRTGEVRVGAGTTFAALLAHLAGHGLTLPVAPGTATLTVGGAIAADVHGKNHPSAGSFARHLSSFALLTPALGEIEVSAEEEPELFDATLGGMGLTGVILAATLRTSVLREPFALADTDRVDSIEAALETIASSEHSHAIAWIDLLAAGRRFSRAVVTRSREGEQATGPASLELRSRRTASLAGRAPSVALRPSSVRAFNAALWMRAPRTQRARPLDMARALFPLDAVADWNRLYGRHGLIQYQFAVPDGNESALRQVPELLRRQGVPMYLAALKRLGARSGGMLSFPLRGWTLAIDIPAGARGPRAGAEERRRARRGGGRAPLPRQGRADERRGAGRDVPRAAALPRGARARRPARGSSLRSLATPGAHTVSRALAETPRRLLVIGGSSEIATAIAAELVDEGAREIVLAGRDATGLGRSAATLLARGATRVETVMLDAARTFAHAGALRAAAETLGGIDVAVLAVGVLGARGGLPEDIPAAVDVLRVNTVGAGSLLMETARLLREQGSGTLIVLSSVAAERPRAANAVYCASKAGLDALARALDDELSPEGVRVMVVRPGFVRTRMTAGLKAAPLATSAAAVAQETLRGLRRDARTVWAPARLRWVMLALRLLPRSLFRRLPA